MLKGKKFSEAIDERELQIRENKRKIDKFLKEHEGEVFVLDDITEEFDIPFGLDGLFFNINDWRYLLSYFGDVFTLGLTKRTRYHNGYVAYCKYWDWKRKK